MAQGAGTQNAIGFAENFDFSGKNPPAESNGLFANGQLWIGRSSDNADGTRIDVNTLTAGAGISITNGPGTITIAAAGGATPVDSFAMQTGTSPVVPDGTGLVTFNGSSVAAGTNPVRTNGTGANTMQLEVQTSQAIAATDATKIGLAAFDSADFTVDASGFVSLASAAVPQTLTPDVGGAVSPVANDIDILGSPGASFPTDSILSHNYAAGVIGIENRRWHTAFVVDPSATVGVRGTYATIAAALTAASSGQTIFIRPGTYTENLTLKAGVNLTGWPSDGTSSQFRQSQFTYNVKIIGKMSFSAAGQCCISNLFLQTNSDNILALSGSNSSNVLFKNCYIYASNNTGISATGTNTAVSFYNCSGDLGTTGIAYFALSGGGNLVIDGGTWGNSGSSVTASTWSAGILTMRNCEFDSFLTSSGTTAVGNIYNVLFNNGGANTTVLTHGSTSATALSIWDCFIGSGTASSISVSAGASVRLLNSEIQSSNTNALTGAGSIEYSDVIFTGTSSLINTTTQTQDYVQLGKWKATGQPAFFATQNTTVANVTGDGTNYTIVFDLEVFDQDSNFNTGTGTFTAPVTGRYHLQYNILAQQATTAMGINTALVTSNRTINSSVGTAQAGNNMSVFSAIVDMDAADTATVTVQYSGGAKVVDIYGTSVADPRTNFSGILVA